MAKPIYKENGELSHYEPGIIYHLVAKQPDGTYLPFYVGETTDKDQRLKSHQREGKNATAESTLVYQTINAFEASGIEWTMETLVEYDKEGPTDLEDEWIMTHLFNGHKLSNMKKGNANWLADREKDAKDMKRRGISSYRKYREILSVEAKQAEADRKHAKWLAEENKRQREIILAKANAIRLTEQQRQREESRKRFFEEQRILQERLKAEREQREAVEKILKEQADAIWEADKPARAARIKAETERLQEAEKQREIEQKRRQEEFDKEEARKIAIIMERADKNYSNWPDDKDRYNLQVNEDNMIKRMEASGYTKEQIDLNIKREKNLLWFPGRTR